jgi:hypothetical protein
MLKIEDFNVKWKNNDENHNIKKNLNLNFIY